VALQLPDVVAVTDTPLARVELESQVNVTVSWSQLALTGGTKLNTALNEEFAGPEAGWSTSEVEACADAVSPTIAAQPITTRTANRRDNIRSSNSVMLARRARRRRKRSSEAVSQ